jgi:redox-sensitive bicupin YhaK (pirin superfamily)
MIFLRKKNDRGHFNHGWLDTYHSFSFADYYDPKFMGFSALRVINEDKIAAQRGFGTHPHKNMEIITYVMKGALEHKDSMGNGSLIKPGEIQYMSAGKGVFHSEWNSSPEEVHLLQIWIMPDQNAYGLEPLYGQYNFLEKQKAKDGWRLLASPTGSDGSIKIRSSTHLWNSILSAGEQCRFDLSPQRSAWLQVGKGQVEVICDGKSFALEGGDGLAIVDQKEIQILASQGSEVLLFDLPA